MAIRIGPPIVPKVCRQCGFEGEWPGRWKPCPNCQKKAA